MKAYGVRKQDDNCCPGHSKYGHPSSSCGKQRKGKRTKAKDKSRKSKERKKSKVYPDVEYVLSLSNEQFDRENVNPRGFHDFSQVKPY